MAGSSKKKKKTFGAPTIDNRKARHEYTIIADMEAGIVLSGTEVKSLRKGLGNLNDAYAGQKNNEIWLNNAYIAEYDGGNQFNHVTRKPRKLLLHRREINKLIGLLKKDGITLVPLKLFFTDKGIVKVKIGVAKGKKKHDKREDSKQRDWDRQKSRLLKTSQQD